MPGQFCTLINTVDPVRPAVQGGDEALGLQLLEHRQGAVAEDETFAGIAIDVGNAAGSIAVMFDMAAFGEDVQRPLLGLGKIHVGLFRNQMHTRRQPPRGAIDAMGISITRGRRGQTELSDCGNLQHTDLTQMEWACPFAGQARMIALPSGRGNRDGVGQGAAGRLAPGLQGKRDGPSSHGMAESGVVIGWWHCCFRDCGRVVAGLSLRA